MRARVSRSLHSSRSVSAIRTHLNAGYVPLTELPNESEKVVLLYRQAILESILPSEFGTQVAYLRGQFFAVRSEIRDTVFEKERLFVLAAIRNTPVSRNIAATKPRGHPVLTQRSDASQALAPFLPDQSPASGSLALKN